METFQELQLSTEVQTALAEMGYVTPSPIQAQAIPHLLEGYDLIGLAQTGTGKTAAFGIPCLEGIDVRHNNTQSIILCPTRELAVQVSEEMKKLGRNIVGLRIAAIYGGDSIERQIKTLRQGAQIVVGTPGRVIDHLERRTLNLEHVNLAILDEADEMLNMGFRDDIEVILAKIPEERQTVFFSATMSPDILNLTHNYQIDPVTVKIAAKELTAINITQTYYEVKGKQKVEAFARLLEYHDLKLMLVFCNTKKMVDELVEQLNARGYEAEGLHGDLRQSQRSNVMAKFRSGATTILVATDVAARGIDVDDVDGVFNYDVPLDEEYYVHRIGRTARAGKFGRSFTFVTPKDFSKLREIERYTKSQILKAEVPSIAEIISIRKAKFAQRVADTITAGGLESFNDVVDMLTEHGHDPKDLLSALVKLNLGEVKFESVDVSVDDPRVKGEYNGKMVRLFISIGKINKVRPGDIVGAIANETNLNGKQIGSIDIFDKYTHVEVPADSVDRVVSIMNKNQIKGRKVSVEVAR